MSENSLKLLVKKALLNYDIKNEKFKEILNIKEYVFKKESAILEFNNLNKKFKFNILGIFDYSKKIWIWSWLVPSYSYVEVTLVGKPGPVLPPILKPAVRIPAPVTSCSATG